MANTIQCHRFESSAQFKAAAAELGIVWLARTRYEDALAAGRGEFSVRGFCVACGKMSEFAVDMKFSGGPRPNWRERLVCSCGLNNRLRASVHFLANELNAAPDSMIYVTEQVTPLARFLRRQHPRAIFSELLRDGTGPGATNGQGIRNEDLCALSMADDSIDHLLSFDVLEHVPDYEKACSEMARVLRPGGDWMQFFEPPDVRVWAGC